MYNIMQFVTAFGFAGFAQEFVCHGNFTFKLSVVRTKSVRVRVDQVNKKVIISTTTHRTFGKQQWQLLREQLDQWQHNLAQIQTSLQTITSQAQ